MKLFYLPVYGRGEAIRMLLHHAKVKFDDMKLMSHSARAGAVAINKEDDKNDKQVSVDLDVLIVECWCKGVVVVWMLCRYIILSIIVPFDSHFFLYILGLNNQRALPSPSHPAAVRPSYDSGACTTSLQGGGYR